ncbi:MAG: sigma 54-interacting transcriptional regulator [Clostridiales Family XIII bacterium]|jgi:PAS domain S-box-containing protein|nr:sigma 54-interacting transcriptional regulator [Clostridiales Family XIII bacterium]
MENDKALELDKAVLVKILDNVFMNIMVTDGEGTIIYTNSRSANLYGMERNELIGMNVQKLVDDGYLSRSQSLSVLKTGKEDIGFNITAQGSNLSGYSMPLFDKNGNIEYVITSSSERGALDRFAGAVDAERMADNYKGAVNYILGFGQGTKELIIKSKVMQELIKKLRQIIKTDSTIVLRGESGVGKDIIATYIHANSDRADEPFIPVNCAAIPRELMEAEFFGYSKGAFTGASKTGKMGLFEISHKGTLFLDEIGDLPLNLQGKLLRTLEDKTTRRIGSDRMIKVDVRIIAATNKDLEEMVEDRTFREDFYYRLNVMSVDIPPLRDRSEDIAPLAELFLRQYNEKFNMNKRLSPDVFAAFQTYQWKGNVRELKNIIERLMIVSMSNLITNKDLKSIGFNRPDKIYASETQETPVRGKDRIALTDGFSDEQEYAKGVEDEEYGVLDAYKKLESRQVLDALIKYNGNKTKAAAALGISRGKLYKLLARDAKGVTE